MEILLVPVGNTFYVLGEVKKPCLPAGSDHPADPGVATAGGFTERAAPNRTEVIRITWMAGRRRSLST
jgi:hypothetical protein